MCSPSTDWDDLLAAARAGSTAAMGQLLEPHRRYLHAVAADELDRDLRAKADAVIAGAKTARHPFASGAEG